MTHTETWQSHNFYAMGSHMTVLLEMDDKGAAANVFAMVVDAFEQAEQRMSRFRPNSELSWLNAQAGNWAELSPLLWNVLIEALDLAAATSGLFDPTLHNAMLAAGYDQSFDKLSEGRNQRLALPSSGGRWHEIMVDPTQRAVYLPESVQIDLGGIGKGFTARTVVGWLSEWGACLIDAGGDLTAGAAPSNAPGWPVGVSAPWERGQVEETNLMRLWLADATLATSGIDYRKWQSSGRQVHHIIDPRTGVSAETDLLTCSVFSADACHAEAWATVTLIAGSDSGYSLLTERNIAAALIDQNGNIKLTPAMRQHVQLEADVDLRLV